MEILLISLIFVLSGIGAEVVGFGISAISMAFLPFLLPLSTTVPLVAIISIVATGVVAYRTKAKGLTKLLLPLFVGSLFGIPIGMYLLDIVPERTLLIFLGIVLISSSGYSLLGKKIKLELNRLNGILIGFFTGVFGASINVNGPLVGMYFTTNEDICKVKNKDLITTYMFFTGVFVVLGHYLAGRVDGEVGLYVLFGLPGLFLGLQIGRVVFEKIPTNVLRVIIYSFVLLAGIRLLF